MTGETTKIDKTVTVFLTPIDAALFLKFQKHHKLFKLLVEKGVFDQTDAAITLNFDSDGNITVIDRHDLLYSARAEAKKVD